MIRLFFLIFFLCSAFYFSPYGVQLVSAEETAEDSLFDDSDLAGIEGSSAELEEDFDSFEEEGNFEQEDFEVVEKKAGKDGKSKKDLGADNFNKEDYEELSDRPGYEVISDEELEKEFEGEDKEEELEENLEESAPQVSDEEAEEFLDDLDEDNVSDSLNLESVDEEVMEDPIEDPIAEETPQPEDVEDEIEFPEDSEEDLLGQQAETLLEEEAVSAEDLNLITNIRYIAEKDQIIIDCSEPASFKDRKNTESNQYIVEILQARLGENLHWPYVLKDFNTKFGLIKADQKSPDTVRVIVQLKKGAGFPKSTSIQNNNQILIAYGKVVGDDIISDTGRSALPSDPRNILPAKTLEDLYFGDVQFSGSPISFHVIDAPVKQVLRFISEESGLNMVIGEKVSGTITLKLEDVPWDQALHTIFKVKSLGYTRDGNVITILPLTEIEERTKRLKEISERQKGMTAFITKVVPVSYGNMSEIADKIKDFSTKQTDTNKGGKIIVHQESGALVVIDTPEAVQKMTALVSHLDVPPKQVMVEAKVVEVSKTFTRNFGLRWTMGGNLPVVINASGLLSLIEGIGGSYGLDTGAGEAGLSLNGLPIIGDISANLSLAESEGYAQVISTPKMVVISGKTASITRNAPILVAQSENETVGGTTGGVSRSRSLNKEDVSIGMTVTPTVTTTGSVFLQVDVTRTEPGPSAGSEGETLKIERNAKTEILARNGQTIVIGGIYEWDTGGGSSGIPFLGKIPFLNMLFKSGNKRESSSELLVFITPKLLDSHE